jgi:sortase (surface protein transpeptidase)
MTTKKSAAAALILFALFSAYVPKTLHAEVISSPVIKVGGYHSLLSVPVIRDYPMYMAVPSVGLYAPIQNVGINAKGEMDVPSGKTNNIGWYKYGASPGEQGSAVLDAHVFAAFSKLQYVGPNADVYISMASGKILHFVVSSSTVYPLKGLSSNILFANDGIERMNLVTCAGNLTADRSTYDHRLVVYTTLVETIS